MTIDELDRLHANAQPGNWRSSLSGRIVAEGWPVVIIDGPNATAIAALHNAWPEVSARLRAAEAEVERLQGEAASLALLVNPQAACDAAATERENRAARAILAINEDDSLVDAATNAMAMTELYRAMWRRDHGHTYLARQAMTSGLAECERLRGQNAAAITPRPLAEWHDDDGVVLWWRFPVEEPPYVGTPLDDDWPVMATATGGTTNYATHWTRLLEPEVPR